MRHYVSHSGARADVYFLFVTAVLIASVYPGVAYAQQSATAEDINGFFQGMIGEWVGTFDQFTDGVKAPTKYFHALTTQTGPDSYETILDSYRIDPETRKPVGAGKSTVTTIIAPDGTATDTIVGEGDVLIDVDTLRPQSISSLRPCGCLRRESCEGLGLEP